MNRPSIYLSDIGRGIKITVDNLLPVEETVLVYDIITREKGHFLTGGMVDIIKIGDRDILVSPEIYDEIEKAVEDGRM